MVWGWYPPVEDPDGHDVDLQIQETRSGRVPSLGRDTTTTRWGPFNDLERLSGHSTCTTVTGGVPTSTQ